MAAEEEFSAITDKIPQRPVTVTEAGGYSLVIVAALGVREGVEGGPMVAAGGFFLATLGRAWHVGEGRRQPWGWWGLR